MLHKFYLLFICLPFFVHAQTWQTLTPFPNLERDDAVAFAIGQNGYLVTGNHNGFGESNRLWIYHTPTDSWSEGATFPGEPRQYASTFTFGPFAYLIGGISQNNVPLNDVYRYNSLTDQWDSLPIFPGLPHWSSATVSFPDAGYLFGGTTLSSTLNQAWKFDFVQETWTVLENLPAIGKRDLFAFTSGNDIYIGGGFSINPIVFYNEMVVYHTQTGTYDNSVPYPNQGIGYSCACNYKGGGVVVGGNHSNGTLTNEAWYFDGNQWIAQPTFSELGIKGMSCFKVNNTAYFVAGIDENGQRTNSLHAFSDTLSNATYLSVYPNPSTDGIFVNAPIGTTVELYNLNGMRLKDVRFDFSDIDYFPILSPGLYLVYANYNGNETIQKVAIY